MSPIILPAVLVTGLSLGALVWALTAGPNATRERIVGNLHRGLHSDPARAAAERGDQESRLTVIARRVTPAGVVRLLDRLHGRAGRPAAWPMERLLVGKILFATAGAGLTLLMSREPTLVLLGLAVTLVGYFVPELLLYSRGIERREQITLELADTLDQMMIAVEAGLATCPQECWAMYPATVTGFLGTPPERMLFCGMAIGYEDAGEPANRLRSERAPAAEWLTLRD